ncbi:cytochrome c biogenesis protein DipZ [Methylobacterium sp. E-045]|uniref:cytochrome c biogenesis protein DipZ n=1 Tax=Methylobacterium sp. E-045 TaxID=2836575 RepID=UPI001FBA43D9|nr:cytochrome c biogenesis protein DipZ [Methylobacterium sp. E-045]MCJ2131169.1 cytochrome c biogenesis protein DipZ [Methylobacterium sp. E-045]
MLLFAVSYLGGVLTILSPCILPVLPFVFARADQPFVKSGLPLLLGMAITFAGVATLAAVGGAWAVDANQYGRFAAIALLAVFGITLLFPGLAERLTRPLVALGSRLSQPTSGTPGNGGTFAASFLLGIATGLLWAPCAGPILGLVLTGAALQGANIQTSLLLLAYAAGAATSLALALVIGGRVFAVMKRSLGVGEWVRRGLGVAVLCGVAAIALGLDTGYLTQISSASTSSAEQALIDKVRPTPSGGSVVDRSNVMMGGSNAMMTGDAAAPEARRDGAAPSGNLLASLSGAVEWINSPPLDAAGLKGKVVLIDFWTYSCINCLRTLPYVRAWAEKYKDQGLVVIGVHAPEFAFEKDIRNVRRAVTDLKIGYPVAVDNDFAIWRAFKNQYWPAHYFLDVTGEVRHEHFGEGEYAESEKIIQDLLAEAGRSGVSRDLVAVDAKGMSAASDKANVKSPEIYIGYQRAENFVTKDATKDGAVRDKPTIYAQPDELSLNHWSLAGDWTVQGERAVSNGADGRIRIRFHARDLHLVLSPSKDDKPVRFKVTIDGHPPGADHGVDVDAQGNGIVTEERLYQLVRQSEGVTDRMFDIEFLGPGAQAFAFTFG